MIKNFVYLDEEKMYSLSSQVFEGVTEYVLNESNKEVENSETQKGPVGSGRILGDILKQKDTLTEKKFLNDYSYALFEKKLIDDELVLELTESDTGVHIDERFKGKPFIKVKAKVTFNDMNSIQNTLLNHNKISRALAYVTHHEEISEEREKLRIARESTTDRNEKSKLKLQEKE